MRNDTPLSETDLAHRYYIDKYCRATHRRDPNAKLRNKGEDLRLPHPQLRNSFQFQLLLLQSKAFRSQGSVTECRIISLRVLRWFSICLFLQKHQQHRWLWIFMVGLFFPCFQVLLSGWSAKSGSAFSCDWQRGSLLTSVVLPRGLLLTLPPITAFTLISSFVGCYIYLLVKGDEPGEPICTNWNSEVPHIFYELDLF